MNNFWQRVRNNIKIIITTKEFRIGLITMTLHLAVVTFFLVTNISFFSNVSDNVFYQESGTTIAQLLHAGTYHWGDVYPHHWFPLFIGILYYIFGSSMAVGVIVNALLSSLAAVLFYKILKESSVSEKVSFWGSVIVFSGYASFMYHSSILLKEVWVVLLLLGTIYLATQMVQGRSNRWVVFGIFLLTFTLLRSLRFFIGFAGAAGFFVYWFINIQEKITKRMVAGLGMIVIVLGLGIALEGLPLIGGMTLVKAVSPDLIHVTRRYSSETASTSTHTVILETVSTGNPPSIPVGGLTETVEQLKEENTRYSFSITGFLKALMTAIIGPFPWQLPLSKYVILFADTLFVYAVLSISLWGVVKMKWRDIKVVAPWIIVAGGIILAVAIGTDNIGAMIRQRVPALIVMGLVACYALDYLWNQSKPVSDRA